MLKQRPYQRMISGNLDVSDPKLLAQLEYSWNVLQQITSLYRGFENLTYPLSVTQLWQLTYTAVRQRWPDLNSKLLQHTRDLIKDLPPGRHCPIVLDYQSFKVAVVKGKLSIRFWNHLTQVYNQNMSKQLQNVKRFRRVLLYPKGNRWKIIFVFDLIPPKPRIGQAVGMYWSADRLTISTGRSWNLRRKNRKEELGHISRQVLEHLISHHVGEMRYCPLQVDRGQLLKRTPKEQILLRMIAARCEEVGIGLLATPVRELHVSCLACKANDFNRNGCARCGAKFDLIILCTRALLLD